MPLGVSIVILLLYPAAVYLIPEPIAARAGWRAAKAARRSVPLVEQLVRLPAPLKERSERNGQYLLCLQLGLTMALTIGFLRHYSPLIGLRDSSGHGFLFAVGLGLFSGVLISFCTLRVKRCFPRLEGSALNHPLRAADWRLWIVIVILAAIAEELWRALSLESLKIVGLSTIFAVSATAFTYAMAQLGGVPGRLLGIWEEVVIALIVGATLAVLFILFHTIVANVFANLIVNFTRMYALKKRAAFTART